MVAAQFDAVAEDLGPVAWKTGMLGSPQTIGVVVQRIEQHGVEALVGDPVMVAKSGDRLLDEAAVVTLREALLPLAMVVTPNLPEAAVLLDRPVDAARAAEAARALCELGPRIAVVKGGHDDGEGVVDVRPDAALGHPVQLPH